MKKHKLQNRNEQQDILEMERRMHKLPLIYITFIVRLMYIKNFSEQSNFIETVGESRKFLLAID